MATSKIPVNDKNVGYSHTNQSLTTFYNEAVETGKTAVFTVSGIFRALMTLDEAWGAGSGGKGLYIVAFSSGGSGGKADVFPVPSGVTITLGTNTLSIQNATENKLWVNFLVMSGKIDSVTISP